MLKDAGDGDVGIPNCLDLVDAHGLRQLDQLMTVEGPQSGSPSCAVRFVGTHTHYSVESASGTGVGEGLERRSSTHRQRPRRRQACPFPQSQRCPEAEINASLQ